MGGYSRPTLALALLAFVLITGVLLGEADRGFGVVQANELLTKIADNDPINYSNVLIEGNLCFNSNNTSVGTYISWNIKQPGPSLKFLINNEHSPKSSSFSTMKLVNSSIMIKESIVNGTVKFNNTSFQNIVTFINTTFCKDIYFVNSTFKKHAYFGGSKFENAHFILTNFSGPTNFNNAIFHRYAIFRGAKFNHYADFSRTQFNGYADFIATLFYKHANLSPNDTFSPEERWFEGGQERTPAEYVTTEIGASLGETLIGNAIPQVANHPPQDYSFSTIFDMTKGTASGYFSYINSSMTDQLFFSGMGDSMLSFRFYLGDLPEVSEISFRNANFSENANFNGANFDQNVSFSSSHFYKSALFGGAKFSNAAIFEGTDFLGHVDFYINNFTKEAHFESSKFNGDAIFHLVNFTGDAHFDYARFEYAKFSYIKINRNFILDNSRFANIKLEGIDFGQKSMLSLTDSDLVRSGSSLFSAEWNSIRNHLAPDGPIYLALINNFKKQESFDDADDCYYQYRMWRQWTKPWWDYTKFTDIFAWLAYGYSMKPYYPLVWSTIFILIFGYNFRRNMSISKYIRKETIVNRSIENNSAVTSVRFETLFTEEPISFIDPFLFSLTAFTSGLTSFIHPSIEYKLAEKYERIILVERIIGSVLIALFIFAVGRLMVR